MVESMVHHLPSQNNLKARNHRHDPQVEVKTGYKGVYVKNISDATTVSSYTDLLFLEVTTGNKFFFTNMYRYGSFNTISTS